MAINRLTIKSEDNSSTTALSSGATFTGSWEENEHPDVGVSVITDSTGVLFFDFSNDETNADTFPVGGFKVYPTKHAFHVAVKLSRSFRVRFQNTGATQTYLRLYTYFGDYRQGNLPVNSSIGEYSDASVVRSVSELEITTKRVDGQRIISKWAQAVVSTAADIWDGAATTPDYTGFPTTTGQFFNVVSTSSADTFGAQGANTLRLYYLDNNYNMFDSTGGFLFTDVNLNGVTEVTSTSQGVRVWRAEVINSGASEGNVGAITVKWATTTGAIFTVISTGVGQSSISAFTIPAGYTGYLKRYNVSVDASSSSNITYVIKTRKSGSGTFRKIRPSRVTDTKDSNRQLFGGEEFPEKTDLVFRVLTASAGGITVEADYGLLLVKNL